MDYTSFNGKSVPSCSLTLSMLKGIYYSLRASKTLDKESNTKIFHTQHNPKFEQS